MRSQNFILILASFAAVVTSLCWTSPLGIMLGRPPRAGLFGPPAKPGDCNLPIGNGGGNVAPRPGPGPSPAVVTSRITVTGPTITACTATTTVSACTSTITTTTTSTDTSTVTETKTTTLYQLDPTSVAAGFSACSGAYGTARPTPLFNPAGVPKCCAPIKERTPAGVLVAQCLG